MFFRKTKRIKELEEKVNRLEAINRYNASVPTTINLVKFETFHKRISFPKGVDPEARERIARKSLTSELYKIPYIKYDEYYDVLTDSFIGNVSIDIVTKER